eukprot:CAMPEP_0117525574 /NCGR_PEP_ID=MMETSP0784-20121206/35840_1 /TAXON_ID=39447 /ORGANISM="" /LENGTH=231 /DNA_ID=CAMNT_0005321775 /DNA_START=54 /DNA_END=746 /DNA_ORIENTATION=+
MARVAAGAGHRLIGLLTFLPEARPAYAIRYEAGELHEAWSVLTNGLRDQFDFKNTLMEHLDNARARSAGQRLLPDRTTQHQAAAANSPCELHSELGAETGCMMGCACRWFQACYPWFPPARGVRSGWTQKAQEGVMQIAGDRLSLNETMVALQASMANSLGHHHQMERNVGMCSVAPVGLFIVSAFLVSFNVCLVVLLRMIFQYYERADETGEALRRIAEVARMSKLPKAA